MTDSRDSEYLRRPDAKGHLKVMALLRDWDPIGVISARNQDEYDGYATTIVRSLDSGVSERELFQFMEKLVTEHMGISCDKRKTMRIAHELVTFWEEWKAEQRP
jgi:hypothetical protein